MAAFGHEPVFLQKDAYLAALCSLQLRQMLTDRQEIMPVGTHLLAGLHAEGEEHPDYEHVLVANATGMQLAFLGTSSDSPTTLR